MSLVSTDDKSDVANGILGRFVNEPAYCRTFSEKADCLENDLRSGWWLEVIAFVYSGYDKQSVGETALAYVKKMNGALNLAARLCVDTPSIDQLHPGIRLRAGHSPIWIVLNHGEITGLYEGPMTQRMLAAFLSRIPELSQTVREIEREHTGVAGRVDRFLQWCGIIHDPDRWFRYYSFSNSIDVLGAQYPPRSC